MLSLLNSRLLSVLVLALGLVALTLSGCAEQRDGSGSGSADDLPPAADDDDDDDDGNDLSIDGVTYGGTLIIGAPDEGGEDEGNEDEGEDAPTEDEDEASLLVTVNYNVSYWVNTQNQVLNCRQTLQATGTVEFGFGLMEGCANCTGLITFDPTTVADISDPNTDAEACDAADLDAEQINFGAVYTTSQAEGGGGDWLTMGLMSVAAQDAAAITWDNTGDITASSLSEAYGDVGLTYVGTGLIFGGAGTFSNEIGMDAVASPESTGGSVYGWWEIIADTEQNPTAADFSAGTYGLGSFWMLGIGG